MALAARASLSIPCHIYAIARGTDLLMANLYSNCPVSGKRTALLIAVPDNRVDDFPKLVNPHRDAKELQRFLGNFQ